MHEYALHWDNFHDSLSSGFLGVYRDQVGVDVTLVCEGGLLQAHKLVLTICSPYFRQIFALNPCQHPIVVLKDVNQLVMQDLLSFIYKGEVNVKENHFEQFMKMAKILQIKGLATSDDIENSTSTERRPPKKAAGSSTPSSQKVNISIKPKLGAKRTLDKDDAEPSTSKRPARSAAPKSFEDPLDDEASIKGDEPIQFEAIKCESVDLNVDADAAPFHFDYTEGEAGDETGAGMGFDDDDNESDDDDDFDATNDSAAANTSNAKSDTEKKKDAQLTLNFQLPITSLPQLEISERILKNEVNIKNLSDFIYLRATGRNVRAMLAVCFTDEFFCANGRLLIGIRRQLPDKCYKIFKVLLDLYNKHHTNIRMSELYDEIRGELRLAKNRLSKKLKREAKQEVLHSLKTENENEFDNIDDITF